MIGTATFSPCGRYRYDLTRTWGDEPPILWCMCNPSTADAEVLDPTINRCVSYSQREGAGGLVVVNLYALRSTDPNALLREPDPTGPGNLEAVRRHVATASLIVAAWGCHKAVKRSLVRLHLPGDVGATGKALVCLGKTSAGYPRHPLYVKGDAKFVPYP